MDKVEQIKTEVERRKKIVDDSILSDEDLIIGERNAYVRILSFIDSLQEEPVSEDLEEAAIEYCGGNKGSDARVRTGFIMGAKWQKVNLWKPADGDDLPEIDKGVIVLAQPYPLEKSEYVVSFAHRPNPDGWDGKSVITGKMVHYTPKLYDKGGWNIPDVKYWLDVELPKEIEL